MFTPYVATLKISLRKLQANVKKGLAEKLRSNVKNDILLRELGMVQGILREDFRNNEIKKGKYVHGIYFNLCEKHDTQEILNNLVTKKAGEFIKRSFEGYVKTEEINLSVKKRDKKGRNRIYTDLSF